MLCQVTQTPLSVYDVKLEADTDTVCYQMPFMNLSDAQICAPWPASVSWIQYSTPPAERAFCSAGMIWQQIETSCMAIESVRQEERNWPPECCHVRFTPACTAMPQHRHRCTIANFSLTEIDMWRYLAGTLSTLLCKHSHPTASFSRGSAFICGHSSVNSVSLSISKRGLHVFLLGLTSCRQKKNEQLIKIKVIFGCQGL